MSSTTYIRSLNNLRSPDLVVVAVSALPGLNAVPV